MKSLWSKSECLKRYRGLNNFLLSSKRWYLIKLSYSNHRKEIYFRQICGQPTQTYVIIQNNYQAECWLFMTVWKAYRCSVAFPRYSQKNSEGKPSSLCVLRNVIPILPCKSTCTRTCNSIMHITFESKVHGNSNTYVLCNKRCFHIITKHDKNLRLHFIP